MAARTLKRSFSGFERRVDGALGASFALVGSGEPVDLGRLRTGSAWSTIKVPIALAVVEAAGGPTGLTPEQRSLIERALTESDNEAAAILFAGLGDPPAATEAVAAVLRAAGDRRTRVSTVGRDGFSPYGQTQWPLDRQREFMVALARDRVVDRPSDRYVLNLLGRTQNDWGFGALGDPAQWKGGWGPDEEGRYLVRQMGLVEVDGERFAVAFAVRPGDGSFESGKGQATRLARWIVDNAPSAETD